MSCHSCCSCECASDDESGVGFGGVFALFWIIGFTLKAFFWVCIFTLTFYCLMRNRFVQVHETAHKKVGGAVGARVVNEEYDESEGYYRVDFAHVRSPVEGFLISAAPLIIAIVPFLVLVGVQVVPVGNVVVSVVGHWAAGLVALAALATVALLGASLSRPSLEDAKHSLSYSKRDMWHPSNLVLAPLSLVWMVVCLPEAVHPRGFVAVDVIWLYALWALSSRVASILMPLLA